LIYECHWNDSSKVELPRAHRRPLRLSLHAGESASGVVPGRVVLESGLARG